MFVSAQRLRVDRDGIEGTVRVIENLGAETYVFVDANKRSLCWRIPGRPDVAVGENRLGFKPEHMHLFSTSTGMRV